MPCLRVTRKTFILSERGCSHLAGARPWVQGPVHVPGPQECPERVSFLSHESSFQLAGLIQFPRSISS